MDFACIIPAAGQGRRAGTYKPLLDLGGQLVIDRVISSARSACSSIVVVGGFDFERLRVHVQKHHSDVKLVHNAEWEKGMFTSIRAGIDGLNGPLFIHPADIPGPSAAVYQELAGAFVSGAQDVFRPVFNDRPGHPVLVAASAVEAVRNSGTDAILRDVLRPLEKMPVPVDEEMILMDFDTMEEFEDLKKLIGQGDVS